MQATKAAIESSQAWRPNDMTPEQSTRAVTDWIASIRAGQTTAESTLEGQEIAVQ
jgi:hypothetical protein